jgi:chorismate mutase
MMDEQILKLRKEIDGLDNELCEILEKRFEISGRLGLLKKEKGIPIEDPEREKEIVLDKKGKYDLPEGFIEEFFQFILKESKRIQMGE